jgi:Flp pilus assembly protein TadG
MTIRCDATTFAGGKVRRRGAAAVEFAVCAPLLFLLLLGLWEVGRITEVGNVMWNSSREGARDASLGLFSAPFCPMVASC